MTRTARLVCFRSSFRNDGSRGGKETPNISHATIDGTRTLCGRSGWETNEGPLVSPEGYRYEPDCQHCAAAWEKITRST